MRRQLNSRPSSPTTFIEPLEDRRLLAALTIAQENALPGSPPSQWDINGAGDSTIQGFATDISINQGQTVSFKIDDQAQAPYHIDIYRMGYYQGNGARLIASIPSSQTQDVAQPAPLTDSTTSLIDCGNWSVTASWQVPTDATSGVYFAKVTRNDTGGASHIVFIVRNDASHSDIYFQTSDTTWQAYNNYGGKSLYGYLSTNGQAAYAVSYNRPFSTRTDSTEDFVFNAEYPMIRWLESNGYDISYSTDVDTARYGNLILNHKVFMSVGHDEYWSAEQRANVVAARDAGVNLAFFSGNEMFWKTRWSPSIDGTNTSYRTLVCYKETSANAKIDPLPNVWTGTWRDPRFSPPADGGQPENAVSGTIFMVNSGSAAIQVPSTYSSLRFWRNTSVASLQSGQTATLSANTIGYEWDSDLDNGFRPAGLIDMSSTTVSGVEVLQDYGSTYGTGTATHNLTLYRAPSGALVFGAGTIQWSWGLDGTHDQGSSTPSVPMQQATVNLLADMHAQPATLRSGLVPATASTDTVAPTAVITSPASGASLNPGVPVTITGTATDTGGGVVADVEVSTDGGLTWHRATGRTSWTYAWTPNAGGTISIMARAVDDSANLQSTPASVSVNVGGTSGTSFWSNAATPTTPSANDPAAVELGVKFRSDVSGYVTGIRFYKGSTNTGTHTGSLWTSTGQILATATFAGETASGWQQVAFANPVLIQPNTTYVASYHTSTGNYADDTGFFTGTTVTSGSLHALADGVDGGNGVYIYGGSAFPNQTWNASNYWVDITFSPGTITVVPTITAQTPAPNTTGVSTSTTVTATFNESVVANSSSFTLKNSAGTAIAGSTAYNDTTKTVTFTPTAALAANTTYTATVSGATDSSGNTMAAPVSWTFTTAAAAIPTVTAQTPAPNATGVSTATTVTATFNESVLAASISFTLKDPSATTVPATAAYNDTTRTVTLTPSSALTAGATYTATVSGATDAAGNTMSAPVSWSFTTAAPVTGAYSLFAPTATPAEISAADTSSVELGVKFRSDVAGLITGIRFYKGSTNTGTHTGTLWSSTGTKLATVTFSNETASGWQQVNFSTPVSIQANTIYVASYHTNVGRYSDNANYFTASVDNGPLHAPTSASSGGNGVYRYGASAFPNSTWNASNYWVDVVFSAGPDTTPPTITAQSPAPNATNVPASTAVSATFSESVQASTISFSLKNAAGTTVAGTSVYNDATKAVTFTLTSPLAANTTYTATVSGAKDTAGNAMTAPVSWSFTTAAPVIPTVTAQTPTPNATGVSTATTVTATFNELVLANSIAFTLKDASGNTVPASVAYNSTTNTASLIPSSALTANSTYTATLSGATDSSGNTMSAPVTWSFTTAPASATTYSLFASTATPTTANSNDGTALELGMKFTTDVPGYITGVRFYKGSLNTGTHAAHLWSSTGQLLATATFTNETASGWQQVNFSTPILIQANTTYIVSYWSSSGYYSDSANYFTSTVNNGPLHAPSSSTSGGNGLYIYGNSAFPTNTWNASNYWVDVVFQPA